MTSTTSKSTKPRWRRKRYIIAAAILALAIPSAALAWIVYDQTATGSATANVTATAPTHVSKVQLTPAASPAIVPGTTTDIKIGVQNNGSVAESISTLAAPTISDNQGGTCSPFVHWTAAGTSGITGHTPYGVGASGPFTYPGAIQTDDQMPASCTNALITFTFSGASTLTP